jgi:poly-gamma-glutamate capsule biosynthesis protein CapA/YwtB (metallophosphatase superfamily)
MMGCGRLRCACAFRGMMVSLVLALFLLEACGRGGFSVVKGTPISTPPARAPDSGAHETITLALGGDVMLARYVDAAIQAKGSRHLWGDVLPLIQEADLALVNLECVIAESGEAFVPERARYFRAVPKAMEALTLAGIDYATLANNHTMDFQAAALMEMIERLDEGGIAHAGAGGNAEEASRYALLETRGIKVGVVAFADHFQEYAATESEPGTNVIPITKDQRYFRRVRESIEAARAAGADLVVFSVHWGPNLQHVPSQDFKDFARAVIDAGADIFHGHSAHVFQGIEIYDGKPVFYDTGDLIDDYYVDMQHKNDQQLLFLIRATTNRIERVELVPILISNIQVNRATGPVFDEIHERITDLSEAMGTEIDRQGDRLVIDVGEHYREQGRTGRKESE